MSFLSNLTSRLPISKKEQIIEYFFALNIGSEKLTAALWEIEGKNLKILETASDAYSSQDDLIPVTDKLLDGVMGIRQLDVSQILFGVPSNWLSDDNLKEEYLAVLRKLVKELELKPLAYVETAHAMVHLLEKTEGIPPTSILVGFEGHHLVVTVARAGKIDGVKIVSRGDSSGASIEKALLNFTNVETLPSKILIYGEGADLKSQLLSYSWMSKLSFLHFPKIDSLDEESEIQAVCLAGASEIKGDINFSAPLKQEHTKKVTSFSAEEVIPETKNVPVTPPPVAEAGMGFVVGDVSAKEEVAVEEPVMNVEEVGNVEPVGEINPEEELDLEMNSEMPGGFRETELTVPEEAAMMEAQALPITKPVAAKFNLKNFLKRPSLKSKKGIALAVLVVILAAFLLAYLFVLKANVKVFVEPKILEKDATVTADPAQKTVDENNNIIPGQVVETDISGTAKASATGSKQIGDPAKGTVKIINNSDSAQNLSKGSVISAGGIKFTLDTSVSVASTSATSDSKSTGTAKVTAQAVGADGNLPSGTQFSSGNSSVAIVAEGNFSGGNSKTVTVVSSDDQQKLLASLASDLRKQAQQKLQDKLPTKKVLAEALAESNVKKTYSKNISDQASDFSLNLTIHYKGTAFEDKDLKQIVGKLVTTQVPDGFELNLNGTQTQADVSKLGADGKLIFAARFQAQLLPKLDAQVIKNKIKGKTPKDADATLKTISNVLGSEITFSPNVPAFLQRLPLMSKNITVEVSLK